MTYSYSFICSFICCISLGRSLVYKYIYTHTFLFFITTVTITRAFIQSETFCVYSARPASNLFLHNLMFAFISEFCDFQASVERKGKWSPFYLYFLIVVYRYIVVWPNGYVFIPGFGALLLWWSVSKRMYFRCIVCFKGWDLSCDGAEQYMANSRFHLIKARNICFYKGSQ